MRAGRLVLFFILIGVSLSVYGSLNKAHNFTQEDCMMCHTNIEKDKPGLKAVTAAVCEKCHKVGKQKLSHPIEIIPEKYIPADMPLVNGEMTCITCHFVHSASVLNVKFTRYFLRRPGRGQLFCSTCHKIDNKGHLVFEKIHTGSFKVTNPNGTLDDYTLQCIECHDRFINRTSLSAGSGKWKHSSFKLNHPVGIIYQNFAVKNQAAYNALTTLPEEIRLFNGKIGCGTCHNVYSKEKFMLVTNNYQSRLCRQCHVK